MPNLSGRALADALGVTEGAVRTAVKAGRIKRESDCRFDLETCRADWARSTDPVRTKVRKKAPAEATHYAPAPAPPAPLPTAGAAELWDVLRQAPALAAWEVAEPGESLQRSFDAFSNLRINIVAELRLCHGVEAPGEFEPVGWAGLAEEFGLAFIDPATMLADWQARRDAP